MNAIKLISLVSLISACAFPQEAEERTFSIPTQQVAAPIDPSNFVLPLNAVFVLGYTQHCTAFAISPTEIMTAAHCLVATPTIVYPEDYRVGLIPTKVDYEIGKYDRAILRLPDDHPTPFTEWLNVDDHSPMVGEQVMIVGKRNEHYFDGIINRRYDNDTWSISTPDDPVGAIPGDSGAPAINMSNGKVVGIITNAGTTMNPVINF